MDEKDILRLQGEIRDAQATEVSARTEADAMVASMRSAGQNPLSEENLPKVSEAYKRADAQTDRITQLQGLMGSKLGVQAERKAEGHNDMAVTAAERFLQSPQYRAAIESGILNRRQTAVQIDGGEAVERSAMVSGNRFRTTFDNTSAAGLLTPDYTGKLIEVLTRPVRLLDLITTGTTDTDTVDWITENARTDAAAFTAFGVAIPESAYGFQHNTTNVKRAGHFVTATRGALMDAGQSRTLIDARLLNGLARHIESQVLSGNNSGENLKGILQYSLTTLARGTDNRVDAVHKAITVIRIASDSNIEPAHLLIHPTDYQLLVLSKDANGNYLFGRPDTNLRPSIWGLTPVVTTLVSSGSPIVADFTELATMWVREGVFLAASDSHSDYFTKGLVAVKAETRLAFAVTQLLAACEITSF